MNNLILNASQLLFINKFRQLYSLLYKDKKQIYMQTQQQLLQNEELFNMSVDLFKQNLHLDSEELQQYYRDQKFHAYIRCIQKVGLMLSKFYQERESDHQIEIQTLKDKNIEFEQKLSNYMDQNQGLKEIIQYFENDRKVYDQRLNKSEHQLERGKHEYQNQISANQQLLKDNKKLKSRNDELSEQNSKLKQNIAELQKNQNDNIQQIKKLNNELSKQKKQIEKLNQEHESLKIQKLIFEKQVESLNKLIEQKDYVIGNKIYKQGEQITYSAEQYYPYYNSTIRAVKQENQEYGSDKQIMKQIEHPILALQFADSRSISVASQRSQTSIRGDCVESINFLQSHQKLSPQHIYNRKHLKTDKKRLDSQTKIDQNKSCKKMQKSKEDVIPIAKALFANKTPKIKDKSMKQKSMTSKVRKQQNSIQKPSNLEDQKNLTAQNNRQTKYKKVRGNASVILNPRKKDITDDIQNFQTKTRIQHSQSVEDLYHNQNSQFFQRQIIEKQLFTRQRMIEELKYQNYSVRQLVLQESQKRTQAELEYEESIEKLKSQLTYFKNQMKRIYGKYVEQKSLSKAYQDQFIRISEQLQEQKIQYERTRRQLKDKCKQFMQEKIGFYRQKYEQVLQKMRQMQIIVLNNKEDNNGVDIQLQSQQNVNRLKKSKSTGLFYKQVKHHSYNTSQQYSEINPFSANHSKNTSFNNIDDDQLIQKRGHANIKIQDYDNIEQIDQAYDNDADLYSYRQEQIEVDFLEKQVQTQAIQLQQIIRRQSIQDDQRTKLQLSVSNLHDSSQISYQFSSLQLRSSQDYSKHKKSQQKLQKIKLLNIYQLQSITIEGQISRITDFDLLEINSKIIESSSIITNDLSDITKIKSSNLFIYQSVFTINLYSQIQKYNQQLQTTKTNLQIIQNQSININNPKNTKNLSKQKSISQIIFPYKKSITNYQTQYDSISQDDSTQTSISSMGDFSVQVNPQQKLLATTQIQTTQNNLQINDLLDCIVIPTKKNVSHFGTKTQSKLTKNKILSQKYIPKPKKTSDLVIKNQFILSQNFKTKKQNNSTNINSQFHQFQIQNMNIKNFEIQTNLSQNLSIINTVINETFFPLQSMKIDHNQSFNEDHLNSVLIDMSQSFQMSQKFIQTLKKKLLLINDNLKMLAEQEKQHDASSSQSGVSKAFKQIQIQIDVNHNKIQMTQTVPAFRSELFQGNVKASKASTNCSISNSYSYLSPFRHDPQDIKLKVTQFYEIEQIESENIESLARIQAQNQGTKPYDNSSYEGSVNKSVNHQNLILQDLQIQNFNQETKKVKSGKKCEKSTTKLSLLLNSPKNHMIHKQQISPVNSPKNKQLKRFFKSKVNRLQKPKELQGLSEEQFNLFCLKFRVNGLKMILTKQSGQMRDQSEYMSGQNDWNKLTSKELFIVFCKQSSKSNILQSKNRQEVIILNQNNLLSLRQGYQFEANKIVLSYGYDRLILGNQQIMLTESQLSYRFKNKVNYFNGQFSKKYRYEDIEQIKSRDYIVTRVLKYKYK